MNRSDQSAQKGVSGHIMVVDDEPLTLNRLRHILEKAGYRVTTFSNPVRALKWLEEHPCDLLISDLRMPYMDGLTLLEEVKRRLKGIEVILITGYASLGGAVEATKRGAFHYLSKPFTPDQVRSLVAQALSEKAMRAEGALQSEAAGPLIIGKGPKMAQVGEVIHQIAPTDCNVLVVGDSGTGKELVARTIHAQSQRNQGPFVAFNCGAFSDELVANELFGHEKEAFTGAVSRREGLLEAANRGTVFLDEIGEMPLSMQVKLLRVLQERELIRVGGTTPVPLDVRIIAATAKDLKAAVGEGFFRQDLYFRLNVVTISLPNLCDRKEDIPLLAYHSLEKFQKRLRKTVKGISAEAMALLQSYAFPGNVRELENIIEHSLAVCQGDVIQVRDLPPDLANLELYSYQRPDRTFLSLEELERDYIQHVLRLTGGVRTRAAEILGIDRASLWRKMKKYGLD